MSRKKDKENLTTDEHRFTQIKKNEAELSPSVSDENKAYKAVLTLEVVCVGRSEEAARDVLQSELAELESYLCSGGIALTLKSCVRLKEIGK